MKLKDNFENFIASVFITVSGIVKGLHENTDYEVLMNEIKENNELLSL